MYSASRVGGRRAPPRRRSELSRVRISESNSGQRLDARDQWRLPGSRDEADHLRMPNRPWAILGLFASTFVLPACGDTPGTADGETSSSSEAGDSGDVGGACRFECEQAADCDQGLPAFDADNFECAAGVCVYAGCNSDAECGNLGICREIGGDAFARCHPACASAADCAIDGGGPLDDAENYQCIEGACAWTGCLDDAECVEVNGEGHVCREFPDLYGEFQYRSCVATCTAPADCAEEGAGRGEANYACQEGACRYLGCFGDSDCDDGLSCAGG